MARVYVGNIDPRVTERELEDEFRTYGVLRSVWVARKPPGFAFIEFDDGRDATDAIRALNGKQGWRVELSRSAGGPGPRRGGPDGGGGGRGGGEEMKCYECGEVGHIARECRMRGGNGGGPPARGRSRSPPPRYRGSPVYGRDSPPPRRRSPSPPPRRRSPSPPPRRDRDDGPSEERAKGRDRSRSRDRDSERERPANKDRDQERDHDQERDRD